MSVVLAFRATRFSEAIAEGRLLGEDIGTDAQLWLQ